MFFHKGNYKENWIPVSSTGMTSSRQPLRHTVTVSLDPANT
ncbi:MAG: WPE palindromic element domain-containing protein [Wolbachia sp.]